MMIFLILAVLIICASIRMAYEPFKSYKQTGDKICLFFVALFLLSGVPMWLLAYHILTHWR